MAHLHGNEWRKSKRAIDKKERAKTKHFGAQVSEYDGGEMQFTSSSDAPKGIVISSSMGRVSLLAEHIQYECSTSKTAPKNLAKGLVPGDVVTLSLQNETPSVTGVTERTNVLSRMRRDSTRRSFAGAEEQIIAANIDMAVVVASSQNPPFHPKLIDRYMILLQHNGIEPVVCLNKADLSTQAEVDKLQAYKDLGIKTITTSTTTQEGIEEFRDLLRGKVAVLVGHSGVGKTSLINAVDPTAKYTTGVVSEKSGKGRHTTTASSLHEWGEGSYIIDTPGIRSLEIWDIDRGDLQYYYPEFEPFIPDCKFPDCLHDNEPVSLCGVKQAIGTSPGIAEARYESYVKILGEL